MAKRICSSCGQLAYCTYKDKKCKSCARKTILCQSCNRERWSLSSDIYCASCNTSRNIRKHLERLERSFKPKSEYNKYLFSLYLKYQERLILNNSSKWQAINYKSVLESKDINVLTTWDSVCKESKIFKATFGKPPNSACPFIKTGRMLEELGVLDFKQKNFEPYISRFQQLPEQQIKYCKSFVDFLKSTKRSPVTIALVVAILLDFSHWLSEHDRVDFMTVTSANIRNFLDDIKVKGLSNFRVIQCYNYLNLFYRWSLSEKQILFNPCAGIKVNKPAPQLFICSEAQCKAIFDFIKNKNSLPEQALLLALILIWAFKSEDLRYAKIEFKKTLIITMPRHKTSRKKYYDREQILILPEHPKWFYDLQIRFYKFWIARYTSLKKSVPHQYLMLPRRRCIQPLTKDTLRNRVTSATKVAVGTKIPPNVLRKTSGFLHSQQGDASILATLGWDSNYCFKYTWVPKIVYHEKITTMTLSENDSSKVR